MPMPETTVNKHDRVIAGQYNVRTARQILYMEAKPITRAMQRRSDEFFRPSVFPPDTGHVPAATLFRESVGQWLSPHI